MLISCLSGKFWLFFVSQRLSLTAFLGSELAVTLLGADFALALQFIVYFLLLSLPHTGCHLGFFLGFIAESRAFLQSPLYEVCSSSRLLFIPFSSLQTFSVLREHHS